MDDSYKSGMDPKKLRDLADNLFTKRLPLLSVWQELAEHFHPLRADFTVKRTLSDDFAGSMMTSYPALCQRDLQDAVGTMLRNGNKPWFHMVAGEAAREDHEGKQWLEWATGVQRRAMYDKSSQFSRATKVGDGDFSAFGQTTIQVRVDMREVRLLYKCHHLRDVVWMEDESGEVCAIFRRWKPDMRTLCRLFDRGTGSSTSVHQKIKSKVSKTPFDEVECYHMMVKADLYDGDAKGMPWRSIYYDCANQHVMENVAQRNKEYVVARWLTLGSQYAHSPATTLALPEARLLQAMTYTLLEAGEKATNPPMIATEQVVRSDMALYAGGTTWIDKDYDERLGEAIRPMALDMRGMPLSLDMQRDSRALISQLFYLNKIKPFLPTQDKEMTAFQAGQIVAQYIREALPLFEPMEAAYNGELCEETFNALLYPPGSAGLGAFGSPADMPRSLQGSDIRFRFASPLHDAVEQEKGDKFLQAHSLIAQAAALDKSAYAVVDTKTALRDALSGIGIPTKWTRSVEAVKQMESDQAAKQQTAELLATMGAGADVAKTLGEAQHMAAA